MSSIFPLITRLGDKSASLGVVIAAIGLMVAVSIWDIFWPANRHCKPAQAS